MWERAEAGSTHVSGQRAADVHCGSVPVGSQEQAGSMPLQAGERCCCYRQRSRRCCHGASRGEGCDGRRERSARAEPGRDCARARAGVGDPALGGDRRAASCSRRRPMACGSDRDRAYRGDVLRCLRGGSGAGGGARGACGRAAAKLGGAWEFGFRPGGGGSRDPRFLRADLQLPPRHLVPVEWTAALLCPHAHLPGEPQHPATQPADVAIDDQCRDEQRGDSTAGAANGRGRFH